MQNTRQLVHPGNIFSVRVVPKWRFDQFLPKIFSCATGFFPFEKAYIFSLILYRSSQNFQGMLTGHIPI